MKILYEMFFVGNPLACTCSLLWLRTWLKESSTLGPQCLDGSLLREIPTSRDDCTSESRLLDPVAPECESEIVTETHSASGSSSWLNLEVRNTTRHHPGTRNNLAPTPEESDYFYDEYVDYPYNETILTSPDRKKIGVQQTGLMKTTGKPKLRPVKPGNMPTIYAASTKKNSTKNSPKEIEVPAGLRSLECATV